MALPLRSLALIPARGGSKGIPRKNIADLGGKPLIAHIIAAARAAGCFADIVVSTDDPEIAAVAKAHGAAVPFLRPAELAQDDTPSLPVAQHALAEMERLTGQPYDALALLQATSPFTRAEDLAAAMAKLAERQSDSVVTVAEEKSKHPFRMKRIVAGDRLINFIDQGFEDTRPRQSLPPVYRRSGGCYASLRRVLTEQNALVSGDCRAVIVPDWTALDIDSPLDLDLARLVAARLAQAKPPL